MPLLGIHLSDMPAGVDMIIMLVMYPKAYI